MNKQTDSTMCFRIRPNCAMLKDRDDDVMPYIIVQEVPQMRGWSGKSAGWVGDGDGRGGVGGLVGEWVVKGGRWRGPVGMWLVGWWSGTRMKECERCGYECEMGMVYPI